MAELNEIVVQWVQHGPVVAVLMISWFSGGAAFIFGAICGWRAYAQVQNMRD